MDFKKINEVLRNLDYLKRNYEIVDRDMSAQQYGNKEGYEIYKVDDLYVKLIYNINSYGSDEFIGLAFVKPREVIVSNYEEF